jgi:hypothetical protein
VFFKDIDWEMVMERKINVPKSKIRKIEPNPVSIQSFLLEEEKNEELIIIGKAPVISPMKMDEKLKNNKNTGSGTKTKEQLNADE